MAKGTVPTVRDGLAEAASAITAAMTAPDAAPLMPVLQQLHGALVGIIQQGHVLQGAGGPGGAAVGGLPQRPPGPPPNQFPSAPGQGLFPRPPGPNPNELRALLASKAGV